MILNELAVWADVALVAPVEPGSVPVGFARVDPSILFRGKWAERLTPGRFRWVESWVGLVGHAEWLARSWLEDRPGPAERIWCSWVARECAAVGPVVGLEEVASGEWRVTSLRKKQIPRCARNDNLRPVQLAVVEVGVIRTVGVGGRAGSGRRGFR